MAQQHELLYFPIPGRGESVRLMLTLGNVPFKDVPMTDWKTEKPKVRWSVLPNLTLPTGEVIGQSRTILRFLGKQTYDAAGQPMYPTNPLDAARVDEVSDFVEDLWGVLVAKVLGVPRKDRPAAAKALIGPGGQVQGMMDQLEHAIAGPGVIGDRVTTADVHVFAAVGWFGSGFYKPISMQDLTKGRPKLAKLLAKVAQVPRIKAYYQSDKHPMRAPYRAAAKL